MNTSNLAQRVARSFVPAVAIAVLLAGTASAQEFSPFQPAQKRPLTQEEVEKQEKLDNDYKSAVKKLPDRKSTDPWGDVRPNSPKPVKKKQP